MASTTNALNGLLYIRDGYVTARWNFPDAVGTPVSAPGGIGNAVSLTYSFLTAAPAYDAEPSFLAFDATQQQAARDVLAYIEEVLDATFSEVAGVGQIAFGQSSQGGGQAGYAYSPTFDYSYSSGNIVSVTERGVGGDVWLNRNLDWAAADWLPGQDGHATLLHELGHALGLKHPFEAGADGYTLDGSLDDESHTVMSYTHAPFSRLITVTGTSGSYSWQETFIRPGTFMPLDIQALQYLYGANTATRAGNDVYQWSHNAELLETIWDGGGVDGIDCSNQTFTCEIDLRAGQYSSIALRQTEAEIREGLELPSWFSQPLPVDTYNGSHNLAIAYGVVIENATGGAGDDWIMGNSANNKLLGSLGMDSLTGGDGQDTLNGVGDADDLKGGKGNDLYIVNTLSDLVTESASQGYDTVQSGVTFTLAANVEKLALTGAGKVNGTGNGLGNQVLGNGAANQLWGNGGADRLEGNNGNDSLYGGDGKDTLSGGLGADAFVFNTPLDAATNLDTVTDFVSGTDKLRLDDDVFQALGQVSAATVLPASRFYKAAGASVAHDGDDRIVYDLATGILYYDADGQGGAAAVKFAVLGTAPDLAAADILVVA